MPNTVTNNDKSEGASWPIAPSYTELFNAVADLKTIQNGGSVSLESEIFRNLNPSATTSLVDYRILPDIGTAIWSFTGHESSGEAEDWISSVGGLAHVNQ